MLRAWAIIYVGNFIGAIGTALLVYLSGQPLNANGAVATVAMRLAADKASLPFDHAFFLGILCNVLVCLAVWLAIGARTTSDKVLAVLFPVSAFVVAGFEHSVANMYLVPLGLFLKAWAPATLWTQMRIDSLGFRRIDVAGILRQPDPGDARQHRRRRRSRWRCLLVHLLATAGRRRPLNNRSEEPANTCREAHGQCAPEGNSRCCLQDVGTTRAGSDRT